MAHDAGMMRKPDILALVMHALGIYGTSGPGSWFFVDDKCALNIDLDSSGVGDRIQVTGAEVRGGFVGVLGARSGVKDGRDAIGGRHGDDGLSAREKRIRSSGI